MSVKETIEAKKAMLEVIESIYNLSADDYSYNTGLYNHCIDNADSEREAQYYALRIEAYNKIYAALEKMI